MILSNFVAVRSEGSEKRRRVFGSFSERIDATLLSETEAAPTLIRSFPFALSNVIQQLKGDKYEVRIRNGEVEGSDTH